MQKARSESASATPSATKKLSSKPSGIFDNDDEDDDLFASPNLGSRRSSVNTFIIFCYACTYYSSIIDN